MSNERMPEQKDGNGLGRALRLLEEIDGHHNLGRALAVLLFFASGGVGLYAAMAAIDAASWLQIGDANTPMLIPAAWVVLLIVWLLTYLLVMFVLDLMGVRDMRAEVKTGLSELTLDASDMRDLSRAVEKRDWKHAALLRSAIEALRRKQPANS